MIRVLLFAVAFAVLPNLATATSSDAAEIVRYRCKDWKAKHIHDAKKAATIAKTLKQLKCEVKEEKHGNHLDVKYRCVDWKQMELKTHEDAHKWEKWLKEYSFETEHKH